MRFEHDSFVARVFARASFHRSNRHRLDSIRAQTRRADVLPRNSAVARKKNSFLCGANHFQRIERIVRQIFQILNVRFVSRIFSVKFFHYESRQAGISQFEIFQILRK